MSKIFYSLLFAFFAAYLLPSKAMAQSVEPATFNITGGYTKPGPTPGTGYYQLEWSIGEATMIETFTTPNFTLTQGILQPCTDKVTKDPLTLLFQKGEYVLFPNPTKGLFELDLLLNVKGQVKMQLVDAIGRIIETRDFHYDGCGKIERFDISRLPDGIYTLHTTLRGDEKRGDGIFVTRNSGFRIAKLGR
jgi:Secretion system C-terminal sorting domain